MSESLRRRLRALELRLEARPELRSFIQAPGESDKRLEARIAAWRAQAPQRRQLSVRVIGLRD